MPQALKTLGLIQFWSCVISLFPLLTLRGNKNWPPSMKVEKGGKIWKQKWLNKLQMVEFECHRHWKPSVSFSFGVGTISLFPLLALWGNKNWPPQYEGEKVWIISEQKGFKRMQMVQYECPKHWKSSVSFTFEVGRLSFTHYWPSGVIKIGLPVWKWKSW